MRDSRIGARQRVGAYPQSQTRRSSGQTVTTADGPTTRRVALLAICTTSSMGAATDCFGVATSMSPFPLAPRAALGRLEGRAAATRSRARASSLSPGPPGCIRSVRAGGATGSDGDCVACAGEGAVWYRRARRRSQVVLPGLGLVRCAPCTGGVGCRLLGLRAPRIRRGAGRARYIRVRVQIAGGRAWLPPIGTRTAPGWVSAETIISATESPQTQVPMTKIASSADEQVAPCGGGNQRRGRR